MSEFFQAVGTVVIVMWILGSIGVIDFKLCAKPVGQCNGVVRK